MRELKFRGMLRTGEWVYGGYVKIKDGANCILSGVCEQREYDGKPLNVLRFNAVKYKTVGQYIGLNDKNGKEIYKGDIATLIDNSGQWGEEDCLTTAVKWSETGLNWNVYPCHDPKKYWLVIGNIYENPELLEDK